MTVIKYDHPDFYKHVEQTLGSGAGIGIDFGSRERDEELVRRVMGRVWEIWEKLARIPRASRMNYIE